MRVVTYRRVSSIEQAEGGLSLDEQNERMDAWCQYMGYTVVERFIDSGISGSKTSRPGFVSCMELVRKKQCDVVLIYSISRFARNTIATLEAVQLMQKNGVQFVSLKENIDTSNAMGYFFLTLMAAVAQLERDQDSERTLDLHQRKRERNERIGGIPFGLRCVGGAFNAKKGRISGGVLVANEEEMEIVNRIVELRGLPDEPGETFESIANLLNTDGVPNRGEGLWNKSMVQKIYNRYANKSN
ncbi:MAG TPA: recombinase family protein [Chitinophagales bacterium]|nr:recombinase family protein [Chitinophagales bacterium]